MYVCVTRSDANSSPCQNSKKVCSTSLRWAAALFIDSARKQNDENRIVDLPLYDVDSRLVEQQAFLEDESPRYHASLNNSATENAVALLLSFG
mmetsp:Transcript_13517/g.22398  ORF Transcript_13517/g.22398 Transcript_13517/m.22398 type:complete len:93 (-) Transcript_13517:957-1235(-)